MARGEGQRQGSASSALITTSIHSKGWTPQDSVTSLQLPRLRTVASLALWGDIKLWATAMGREGRRREDLGVVHSRREDPS